MDNSLKGLLLAASTLITCIILSIGFYFAEEAKAVSATSANKLDKFSTELTESDLTMYDDLEVKGSDIINFMKKQLGEYSALETAPIYVYVKTSAAETTYTNGSAIDNIKNFAQLEYINPLGKFHGRIERDANDVIIGVRFTQI